MQIIKKCHVRTDDDETTPRFNFNSINLPKCCQMVSQIKAIDMYNKKRGKYQKSMCMQKAKEAPKVNVKGNV